MTARTLLRWFLQRSIAPTTIRVLLSTLALAAPLRSAEARVVQQRAADEQNVAICIARSAAGRDWLAKTLWGLRDQERGWIGAEIANGDGSHDLGPLQVNSRWVPRLAAVTGRSEHHIRQWLKHDACFNVEAARWIFLSGFAATRDYWRAIGSYHSPTVWRQGRYAQGVVLKLRRRFGPGVFQQRQRPIAASAADPVKRGDGTNARFLLSNVTGRAHR